MARRSRVPIEIYAGSVWAKNAAYSNGAVKIDMVDRSGTPEIPVYVPMMQIRTRAGGDLLLDLSIGNGRILYDSQNPYVIQFLVDAESTKITTQMGEYDLKLIPVNASDTAASVLAAGTDFGQARVILDPLTLTGLQEIIFDELGGGGFSSAFTDWHGELASGDLIQGYGSSTAFDDYFKVVSTAVSPNYSVTVAKNVGTETLSTGTPYSIRNIVLNPLAAIRLIGGTVTINQEVTENV